MKKIIITIILLFCLIFLCKITPSHAATGLTYFVTCVERDNYNNIYQYTIFNSYPVPTLYTRSDLNNMPVVDGYFLNSYSTEVSLEYCMNKLYEQLAYYSENGVPSGRYETSYSVVGGWNRYAVITTFYAVGNYTNNSNYEPVEPSEPEPDPPDPDSSSWLSDMWEWFLWQLGINDDYSGDIDAYITGGDRERMEYVTPTPSPTPTPYPSPTPYDLNINYPDGTTGTITGIPGSTTIINGGDTTNNYGSDFDIFAVDVQIGDGGSSNPKDGLNSVMDASNDYLKDVDITPVQNSFSIIPNDWFLLIGVLAALPFIAGFIMRLLK